MKPILIIYASLLLFAQGCVSSSSKKESKNENSASKTAMKQVETENETYDLSAINKNAGDIRFEIDTVFASSSFQKIKYLKAFPDQHFLLLQKSGCISEFTSEGKIVNTFTPEVKGEITSLATGTKGQIYVFSNQSKSKKFKVRGKWVEKKNSLGIECDVFDRNGKHQHKILLDTLDSVFAAEIANNKLIVSDAGRKKIGIFDLESGQHIAVLDQFRPCGGILDFTIHKQKIIVSNLGAFQLSFYNLEGKHLGNFGKRGSGLSDFQGCCNPVSTRVLSNQSIVTLEKFPSRIKIYHKDGTSSLPVAKELEGCKYMPFVTDHEDGLYIVAGEKGIVKYKVKKKI